MDDVTAVIPKLVFQQRQKKQATINALVVTREGVRASRQTAASKERHLEGDAAHGEVARQWWWLQEVEGGPA